MVSWLAPLRPCHVLATSFVVVSAASELAFVPGSSSFELESAGASAGSAAFCAVQDASPSHDARSKVAARAHHAGAPERSGNSFIRLYIVLVNGGQQWPIENMRRPARYRWHKPMLLLPDIRRGSRFQVFWQTKRARPAAHLRCSRANSLQTVFHSGACGFRRRRRVELISSNHTKSQQK